MYALILSLSTALGHESFAVRDRTHRALDSLGPICLPVAAVACHSSDAERVARGRRLWKKHDRFSIYLVAYALLFCDYKAGPCLPHGMDLEGYGEPLLDACLDLVGVPEQHHDRRWLKQVIVLPVSEKVNIVRESIRGLRDELSGVYVAPGLKREWKQTTEPPKAP